MKLKIPLGNTKIRICDLKEQIYYLQSLGYNEYENIPVKSWLHFYFLKTGIHKTFAFLTPDYKNKEDK